MSEVTPSAILTKEEKSKGPVSAAGPAVKVSAAVQEVPILLCHAQIPEARAAAVVHAAVAEAAER